MYKMDKSELDWSKKKDVAIYGRGNMALVSCILSKENNRLVSSNTKCVWPTYSSGENKFLSRRIWAKAD